MDAGIEAQEGVMTDKNHNDMDDQLEEHSLPGMNQAGEGPDEPERDADDGAPMDERLREHSLPGMNQAGEGPEAEDPADRPPTKTPASGNRSYAR